MMNNKESLNEGVIFHGPGACPKCSTPLVVIENEYTAMELNQDGTVFEVDETSVSCRAGCPNCGFKQNMIQWKGRYVPYTENSYNLLKAEFESEVNCRKSKGRYSVKGNPLIKDN